MGGGTLLLLFSGTSSPVATPPLIWPLRRRGPVVPPVPPLTLPEALIAAILADSTLSGLVGTRVYAGRMPRKTPTGNAQPYPAIVLRIPELEYGQDLDGRDGTADARVEFVALSPRYLQAKAIVAALSSLFDPMGRVALSGVPILAAIPTDDVIDYDLPDDATDAGIYPDGISVRFLHETP